MKWFAQSFCTTLCLILLLALVVDVEVPSQFRLLFLVSHQKSQAGPKKKTLTNRINWQLFRGNAGAAAAATSSMAEGAAAAAAPSNLGIGDVDEKEEEEGSPLEEDYFFEKWRGVLARDGTEISWDD